MDQEIDNEVEQPSTEVDSEPEVSIDKMIDKIIDGDNNSAKDDFEALINAKLQAALDAKKQELAQSVYGNNTAEPEEGSEEEPEPEEQEA